MLPNHLILCRPLLLLPSVFPSIRVFSDESALRIRWPKYRSFSFSFLPIRKKATEPSDSIAGLVMPAYDCLWNNGRGRNQDANTFAPSHRLLIGSPYLSPQTPLGGTVGTVLEAWTYCVPLSTSWELQSPFYFLQTLSPYFLLGFGGRRKPKFWPASHPALPMLDLLLTSNRCSFWDEMPGRKHHLAITISPGRELTTDGFTALNVSSIELVLTVSLQAAKKTEAPWEWVLWEGIHTY